MTDIEMSGEVDDPTLSAVISKLLDGFGVVLRGLMRMVVAGSTVPLRRRVAVAR